MSVFDVEIQTLYNWLIDTAVAVTLYVYIMAITFKT